MNLLVCSVVGGLIGRLASMLMGTTEPQGVVFSVVVGIGGALLAGLLISPLFGVGAIIENAFSLIGMYLSFFGAVALLATVNLVRHGTTS